MRPVILTYSTFDVSGIQTQMLLLANAAVDMGIPVTIFALKGGLEAFLDERVVFIEPENYRRYHLDVTRYILEHKLTDAIIWASHPFELGRLFAVSRRLARVGVACSTCVGVYHPRACFKPEDSVITEAMCRLNFLAAEPQQVYFMSEAVKQSHEVRWGPFKKSHEVAPVILPDRQRSGNCAGEGERKRIVSIGRLVPWKSYNTSIPGIAKALSDQGLDLIWDVYGSGPLLDGLQQEVDTLGLSDRVVFHGTVDFTELDKVLSAADLFIGMGTSMLEAAIRRVPCIVAVDSSAAHCYGMLTDVPIGNVGEIQEHAPDVAIKDLVDAVLRLPLSERRAVGDQCYRTARSQSLTPDAFAGQLQDLPRDRARKLIKVWASMVFFAYQGLPRPRRLKSLLQSGRKKSYG